MIPTHENSDLQRTLEAISATFSPKSDFQLMHIHYSVKCLFSSSLGYSEQPWYNYFYRSAQLCDKIQINAFLRRLSFPPLMIAAETQTGEQSWNAEVRLWMEYFFHDIHLHSQRQNQNLALQCEKGDASLRWPLFTAVWQKKSPWQLLQRPKTIIITEDDGVPTSVCCSTVDPPKLNLTLHMYIFQKID